MSRKIFSILWLFIMLAAVPMTPLAAQSDPADPEEVARIQLGHQKVDGVVIKIKSGLYTVKASTGATLTLAEAAAVRHGQRVPKIGDEMTLWVNEGNMVIDVRPKEQTGKTPRFIAGTIVSIDNGKSRMTMSTPGGEKRFNLSPRAACSGISLSALRSRSK